MNTKLPSASAAERGRLVDHPGSLGRLQRVFTRRRIAMAADSEGNLVLVRPDGAVAEVAREPRSYERDVKRIEKIFKDQGERLRAAGPPTSGVVRVGFPVDEPPDDDDGTFRWAVGPVQGAVDRLREAGFTAEANHVMLASQGVTGSPVGAEANFAGGMMFTAEVRETAVGPVLVSTSEPAQAPPALRPRLNLRNRERPQVLVLDTGLCTERAGGTAVEHPALRGFVKLHKPWEKQGPDAIDDEDEPDDDASGCLDFEGGHGTFISGIIRQLCPDAEVSTAGVLSSFGDGDVATVIAGFERVLALPDAPRFDLVVMSLGGYMTDDDGSLFGRALARLLGNGLGVAAAGNQRTSRRYFPAALPDIVGVGALDEGAPAWFTNFGGWVDACAPGVDVVSTFFLDYQETIGPDPEDEEREVPARTYTGWARWSGSSFAAPKVAAAIAQERYLTGCSTREAWRRLSHHKRYRVADLGTVFNL